MNNFNRCKEFIITAISAVLTAWAVYMLWSSENVTELYFNIVYMVIGAAISWFLKK